MHSGDQRAAEGLWGLSVTLNLPETEFSLGRWKVMEVGMNSSYYHSYLLLKPESKAKYMGKERQKKCWDLGPYQTCVNHPHGSGYI